MKKSIILLTLTSLSLSSHAQEQSWLDKLKSLVGIEVSQEQKAENIEQQMPNIGDMVSQVTHSLGVNKTQAEGGLASIFNYVKGNISGQQFSQLSQALPGVGNLLNAVPDISQLSNTQGLGGLLDKAAQYSDSVKALNDVKKQFEALGLKPEMISDFADQAQKYLDTEQGQQAKGLLSQGLTKLLG